MLTHILYDSNLQKKGDVTSGSYITHITIIIIIITLSLHHHHHDHVIHARLIDLEIIIIISYSLQHHSVLLSLQGYHAFFGPVS